MDENNSIQLFEDRKIRTAWDEEKEEWYFSVVDVIAVLTDQPTARNASTYWAVLKKRLKEEGASELLTNCKQLKMRATDGKMRLTDVASTEQLLRIIQSIPSPKAEPFKRWLAQVGRERIEETIDPEQAIDRALETYQKKGYDADWIHQRILSIRVRNELTAEWQARGVEQGREYAILTDEITKAWSGMTTRQYKNLKGLKKENLRDNMSTLEIVLNMLAETTTTELSKAHQPEGFEESRIVARRGGKVAGDARRAIVLGVDDFCHRINDAAHQLAVDTCLLFQILNHRQINFLNGQAVQYTVQQDVQLQDCLLVKLLGHVDDFVADDVSFYHNNCKDLRRVDFGELDELQLVPVIGGGRYHGSIIGIGSQDLHNLLQYLLHLIGSLNHQVFQLLYLVILLFQNTIHV